MESLAESLPFAVIAILLLTVLALVAKVFPRANPHGRCRRRATKDW